MNSILSGKVRQQVARRLSWGIADQAVSSLQNFLLGVYVARLMGAASLGALALALVVYAIVVSASRALSTDPLMIRFSDAAQDRWTQAVAASGGVAVLVGGAGGVVCAGFGSLLLGHLPEVGAAFVALGLVLPALTLQDSWRYAFFAAGQGSRALLNDTAWTVLLGATLLVGGLVGLRGIAWVLLAFGGSALLSASLGMLQARTLPRCRSAAEWLRQHRDLGPRFLVENVVLGAAGKIRMFVLAATVSLAAAGAIRGAEMLIGPVAALLMGVAQVAVPEAVRARKRAGLMRLCLGLSTGLAGVTLVWGLVVLIVFPFGIGRLLLGSVWADAYPLAVGVVVSTMAGCLHLGPSSGLRALGRADKTMPCQLTVSALVVAFSCGGALAWGAVGAVWGTAVAATLGAGIWWRQLVVAMRAHDSVPAAGAAFLNAHADISNRR